MSEMLNAPEGASPRPASGKPPSPAYTIPAAESASTFWPVLKSALYHARREKATFAIANAIATIQTAGRYPSSTRRLRSTVEAMLSMAFPVIVESQRLSASRLTRIQAATWTGPMVRNSGKADARTAAPATMIKLM